MWTKSHEKKMAKKRHAGNFAAGYVKIDEHHLLRTGLRGRKRWLFCCGATLLILLAIGNLAVTNTYNEYLTLSVEPLAQLSIAGSASHWTYWITIYGVRF